MTRLHRLPIRIRLTLLTTAVYGGLLFLYACLTAILLYLYFDHHLDETLKEDLEIVTQLLVSAPEGTFPLETHEHPAARAERHLELWGIDGRLLYRSATLGGRALGESPRVDELDGAVRISSTRIAEGSRWRIAGVASDLRGRKVFVRLAVSEEPFVDDFNTVISVILFGIPVGIILVAASGYLLARGALRPVDVMAATALRIGGKNLRERIPVNDPHDELGRLATTLNDLLDRIEGSFLRLQRFTADASHELRTPLTAMRSVGEVGLQESSTVDEYREVVGSMLEENTRLVRLVDNLLLLSRADDGSSPVRREVIPLRPFLRQAADTLAVLGEEKGQSLIVECEPGVAVTADPALLRHALLNLIDNAIKFSPPGGTIRLHVPPAPGTHTIIEVIDSGPGIPEAERSRIFERFSRLEHGAGTEVRGSGLGLAIVRWAVEANGGSVEVVPHEGAGSTFRIQIPHSIGAF